MASLQKPQKKEGLHFVRCFTKRDTKKRALYEDNVMYLVGQAESSIGKSSQTGFVIGGITTTNVNSGLFQTKTASGN